MSSAPANVQPQSTMAEIMKAYPGARRALFRRYHIGGCSSCGFQPEETLEQVCQRNNQLDPPQVLRHIQESHEQDAAILIAPEELAELRKADPSVPILDIRSRSEFEAARISGAIFMNQQTMQEIMSQWPRDRRFVIVDHEGKQGLDAAAYFLGHGFQCVRCLQGGIDAWSKKVDATIPRYQIA